MKIINVFLMGLLTGLFGGEGVKAQQCDTGLCYCSLRGDCEFPSCPGNNCPSETTCSCSSANLPFVPQAGFAYKFSSETYFMCDSSEDLRPVLLKNNIYMCSTNEPTLVQPEFNKKMHITIDSTVLYRFPEGMIFYCDETPGVVNEGLPSQYYTCPVTSSNKLKDREVTSNK
jgi:hypothetical protein